jgi:MFS transporter, UMF1 family
MTVVAQAQKKKKEIFGWTMYDWAVSGFSTSVVTVFMGPYLSAIAEGAADANGFIYLGNIPIAFNSYFAFCVSASVLLQVGILPLLGAMADHSNLRKKMMVFFSLLGSISTILMFFIVDGMHWVGGLLFIIANLSLGASMVFYNAYLPEIADIDERDNISAKGFAMGYLGGGLLLLINLILFLFQDAIGLDGGMVARISLASAGLWWLGFSTITFKALDIDKYEEKLLSLTEILVGGYTQLASLLELPVKTVAALMSLPFIIPILFFLNLDIRLVLLPTLGPLVILGYFVKRKSKSLPEAMKYLIAYLFYNDGIQTVIAVSSIYAVVEIKMETTNLILLILMIQFVAYFGAMWFAKLADKFGTVKALIGSLVIWSFVVLYAYAGLKNTEIVAGLGIPRAELEFWLMGFVIAIILGGSQALSRSLYAQMIPKSQEAEFFSFYEVSERGTSWLGTFIFGIANQVSGSMRVGILSVLIFFLVGLIILPTVNVNKAIEQGKNA